MPTYQVSILNDTEYADDRFLHRFLYYDPDCNISLGGLTRIFTVELPKVETVAYNKAVREMTSAERWAVYFLYNADESTFARKLIEEIVKEEAGVKMATEILDGYTADERRYYRLLSELKYEMDHYNLMADAEERGIQIGEERGIQIGEAKAQAEREAAVNALRAAGVPDEIIEKAYPDTGL
jgi:hypothetical protein